jgi:crossover junction endodeoxyribonuclease RuvC
MILSLDLSLTASGYAMTDGRSGVLEPPKTVGLGIRRLQWIRFTVLQLAMPADLIVIEGYAFAAANQAHQLGELGGVVRIALADRDKTVVVIPPASLKLYATGSGKAKKDEVLAAAIRSLGYDGHNHNTADALWLLEMARAKYSGASLTEPKTRALSKLTWPALGREVLQPEVALA